MNRLQELLERRAYECRLTPDRALRSVEEAAEFLRERGMLTWAPDSWGHVFTAPSRSGDIADVLVAGVRAAVVTPEHAIGRWFSWRWRLEPGVIDGLVATGRLERPEPGWVALPA